MARIRSLLDEKRCEAALLGWAKEGGGGPGRLTSTRSVRWCAQAPRRSLPFVIVHGLGAATLPALELALHLDRLAPAQYTLGVNTHTVRLVDDINPLNEVRETLGVDRRGRNRLSRAAARRACRGSAAQDVEPSVEQRSNSAVSITIRRAAAAPPTGPRPNASGPSS